MTASWSSDRDRLLVVGGSGLLDHGRVGVAATRVPERGAPALFRAGQDAPVRVMPLPDLPEGVVAVGEALAGRLRLSETGGDPWALFVGQAAPAAFATVEPMTDGVFKTLAEELSRATDVAGQVLWVADADSTWLSVDGAPMLVREVTDAEGRALTGLVEITGQTELLMFSPGNRTGVDIVVLADCSGSMSIDDVGRSPMGGIKRSEALRNALQRMLAARRRVAGRVSRIALVKFTHESAGVFPRAGGMAEMDADAPPAVFEEFESAVNQLIPQKAATDIGQALHAASELLHRHGVPGNDQLIVLVSDGAHWQPKGEDATGELVAATDDPISLMDELHRAAKIRLHAIGISDRQSFDVWWRANYGSQQQNITLIPNHDLLGALMNVGGGDAARIGGVDVLEEYFGGLGAGVSRRVGRPASPRTPALQPEMREALSRLNQIDVRLRQEIERLADEIRGVYSLCAEASQRRKVGKVFRPSNRHTDLVELGQPVLSRRDFVSWISSVYKVFHENLDSRLQNGGPYPVDGVDEVLGRGSEFARLFALRNDEMHDMPKGDTRSWAGDFYARWTGRFALTPDDAGSWAKLQHGALQTILDALRKAEALINRAPEANEAPPAEEEDEVQLVGWTIS
ncbi:vWA domain-containing protein [Actinoplanes sp. CA-131856]